MIIDRFEVEVCPKISAKCLTDIELWLLFRAFRTDRKNGYIGFSGCWSLNEICERLILPDKELYKALFTSRQVCPELCAEVEHLIREVGFIMRNFVNYERIFQAIIRRHPNFLDQVSITRGFMHLRPSVTLITATEIVRDGKTASYDDHPWTSTPWESDPCYIMFKEQQALYAKWFYPSEV